MSKNNFFTLNLSNKDGSELDEICEPGKGGDIMKEIDEATIEDKSSSSSSNLNNNKNKNNNNNNNGGNGAPLPLQYRWCIWEQIVPEGKDVLKRAEHYSENTKELARFDTVQKFWSLWYHMPPPSELFEQKRMVREGQDGKQHVVDALMIFREGIKPEWEDPVNRNGGHFEYKIFQNKISPEQVNEFWNNLVLGLVGSTIEYNHLITGVRLVDKLSNVRVGSIRFEVWFSECKNEKTLMALWKSIDKCIATQLDGTENAVPSSTKRMHFERLDGNK